jgi:hypothetical protein
LRQRSGEQCRLATATVPPPRRPCRSNTDRCPRCRLCPAKQCHRDKHTIVSQVRTGSESGQRERQESQKREQRSIASKRRGIMHQVSHQTEQGSPPVLGSVDASSPSALAWPDSSQDKSAGQSVVVLWPTQQSGLPTRPRPSFSALVCSRPSPPGTPSVCIQRRWAPGLPPGRTGLPQGRGCAGCRHISPRHCTGRSGL